MPISVANDLKAKAHDLAHHRLTCWIGNPCLISAAIALILTIIMLVTVTYDKSPTGCVKLFLRMFMGLVLVMVVHNTFVKEQLKEKYINDSENRMMKDLKHPISGMSGSEQFEPRTAKQIPPIINGEYLQQPQQYQQMMPQQMMMMPQQQQQMMMPQQQQQQMMPQQQQQMMPQQQTSMGSIPSTMFVK
jgi:hypothetical protein